MFQHHMQAVQGFWGQLHHVPFRIPQIDEDDGVWLDHTDSMDYNPAMIVAHQQIYSNPRYSQPSARPESPRRSKSALVRRKIRPQYHRSPLSNVTQPTVVRHSLSPTVEATTINDPPPTTPRPSNPVVKFFQCLLTFFINGCFIDEEEETRPFLHSNHSWPASESVSPKNSNSQPLPRLKVQPLPRMKVVASPIYVATANKTLCRKLKDDEMRSVTRDIPSSVRLEILVRGEKEMVRKVGAEGVEKVSRRFNRPVRPANTRLWTDEWKAHHHENQFPGEEIDVHAAVA